MIDAARSLENADELRRRNALLHEPHIAPLTAYANELQATGSPRQTVFEVPNFDPLDGGTNARLLFLFEKPGPMTSVARGGSGFISRNNDDPTANATFDFMREAGIPRSEVVIWNVIPWWNGTRIITPVELRDGVASVVNLIRLLPRLSCVVLVGRKAGRAVPILQGQGVPIFSSVHPSPIVRARWPEQWMKIPAEWSSAFASLSGDN